MSSQKPGLLGRIFGFLGLGLKVIPSLVQLMLLELIGTFYLGGGVLARVADRAGWSGAPILAPPDWGLLGYGLVGAACLWPVVRDIWNPGVTKQRWSPVRNFGPVSLVFARDPAGMNYAFLGSHPAYALMDLVALIPPLLISLIGWDDDASVNPTLRVCHWWLAFGALIPAFRLIAWFVLRRGPGVVDALARGMGAGDSPARRRAFEWQHFWSGPLAFWAIAGLVLAPALAVAFSEKAKADPPLTAEVIRDLYGTKRASNDRLRFRLRGALRGAVKEWPAGAGRPYASAGVVVALADGPEVAVFVGVNELKRFRKSLVNQRDGIFTCTVRPLDRGGQEVSDHFRRNYGWDDQELGPVPAEAKAFTPTGRRMLVFYVDP